MLIIYVTEPAAVNTAVFTLIYIPGSGLFIFAGIVNSHASKCKSRSLEQRMFIFFVTHGNLLIDYNDMWVKNRAGKKFELENPILCE